MVHGAISACVRSGHAGALLGSALGLAGFNMFNDMHYIDICLNNKILLLFSTIAVDLQSDFARNTCASDQRCASEWRHGWCVNEGRPF